jgi:ubiquinone/menaquinone biosynthesis C-methylase UbiE
VEAQKVRRRFDRIAWIYDLMETPMEVIGAGKWRGPLLASVRGRVLEVGIGTGKNLPYYPPGIDLTGIDISPRMLDKARRRAQDLRLDVDLRVMDVEATTFPGESFDYVVSTFVFCSVPDPVAGLREVRRVLKKDGTALFLEHVRSEHAVLGALMDLLNPLTRRMIGPNINRRTVENIRAAGLDILSLETLGPEIIKRIRAGRGNS